MEMRKGRSGNGRENKAPPCQKSLVFFLCLQRPYSKSQIELRVCIDSHLALRKHLGDMKH